MRERVRLKLATAQREGIPKLTPFLLRTSIAPPPTLGFRENLKVIQGGVWVDFNGH